MKGIKNMFITCTNIETVTQQLLMLIKNIYIIYLYKCVRVTFFKDNNFYFSEEIFNLLFC